MSLHDLFPSSPSSASSYPSLRFSDSPLTPNSYFSPAPALVAPDDFTILGDSPNRSSVSEPSFVSADDVSKVRVFLRNKGRWENMYDRFESSPRVSPLSQGDRFSWDPTHSVLLDAHRFPDPSRCSLLIQEVSLLVGLAPEHDHLPPVDSYPTILDDSTRAPDILPLTLTPTKSLTPRKRKEDSLSRPTSTHLSSINPQPDDADSSAHGEKFAPDGSTDSVIPTARHKSADADRPSLSARRQGRVFCFEPSVSIASRPDASDMDKTFLDPREPPPKPASNLTANRCSSLDRLECSLMKLEAYAPSSHRKSQSDGRAPVRVPQRSDKRPSLPPPRRLKKQQSNHDVVHRNTPHPAHGYPPSSHPSPKQVPVSPYDTPLICPAASLEHETREHNLTPGSFMDMDITYVEEASRKQQESAHQVKSREKIKSLASVAKRVSRGVIAWGKNLTGSTKPSNKAQNTTTSHSSRF